MHLRDPSTARVMRRAAVGPHALMQRGAIAPYVPDRGSAGPQGLGFYMPSRGLGAAPIVGQTVTGVKTGVTTASIATGVGTSIAAAVGSGAAAGSVIPIVGTAIGAIVGLIASGVFSHRKDPEDYNFQQAMAMARTNGPQSVLDIGNKYLVLAGLFDLTSSQIKGNIPIYKKYGRMGEYRFVTDMCNLIYSAAQQGKIVPTDTPQSVFNRIVQPWINSFGYGAMTDSNAEMITYILLGMTAEYIAGLQTRWYAVGGDYPFGSLPPFSLPGAVQPTSSATPSPVYTQPQPQPVVSAAPTSTQQVTQPTELQSYLNGVIPQNGASIGYARDSVTGNFMALPAGGTYAGQAGPGQWIVQYTTGQYQLKNGVLVPYNPTPAAVTQTPAPSSAVISTVDTGGTPPIIAMPNQMPQVSYGGGGGYLTPISSTPTAVQPSSAGLLGDLSWEKVALAAGAIFALSLLLPHNMKAVRSAR